MDTETENEGQPITTAVEAIRLLLESLPTDEDRLEAMSGICKACGTLYTPCFCTRDE